jgi:hypothetical protein
MAKNTAQQVTDDGFETVAEARTKMQFDADGDVWEGYWEGFATVTDPNTEEEYEYMNFRDEAGDGYQVSASYQLKRAFADIPTGMYSRIQRLSVTSTKRGNMINFRVQVRR